MSKEKAEFFIPTPDQPRKGKSWTDKGGIGSFVIGGIVAGLVFGGVLLGGLYWFVTADERMERTATEALVFQTDAKKWLIKHRDVVALTNGDFARVEHHNVSCKWKIERAESSAYPFTAVAEFQSNPRSTISHKTKEGAERDKTFYASHGRKFFPDNKNYRGGTYDLVVEYQYDKASGTWKVRSEEET
jgi:hypothetical protein